MVCLAWSHVNKSLCENVYLRILIFIDTYKHIAFFLMLFSFVFRLLEEDFKLLFVRMFGLEFADILMSCGRCLFHFLLVVWLFCRCVYNFSWLCVVGYVLVPVLLNFLWISRRCILFQCWYVWPNLRQPVCGVFVWIFRTTECIFIFNW